MENKFIIIIVAACIWLCINSVIDFFRVRKLKKKNLILSQELAKMDQKNITLQAQVKRQLINDDETKLISNKDGTYHILSNITFQCGLYTDMIAAMNAQEQIQSYIDGKADLSIYIKPKLF